MGFCLACSAALLISVTTDRPLIAIAQTHVPVLRARRAAEGEHDPEGAAETAPAAPGEAGTAPGGAGQAPADPAAQTPAGAQPPAEAQTPAGAQPPAGETGQEALSGTNAGYVLTEDYLESQLAGFLPENFPAEDIDVSFDGGLLSLSFDMSRAGLKSYLQEQGAELGLRRSLLLQMLPREVELEAVFALSADESGLHLTPVTFVAGEKEFSLSGLPQDTFSAVDAGLNALLQSAGVSFSTAEFVEDGLLLK